jgi:hypothetical protein
MGGCQNANAATCQFESPFLSLHLLLDRISRHAVHTGTSTKKVGTCIHTRVNYCAESYYRARHVLLAATGMYAILPSREK